MRLDRTTVIAGPAIVKFGGQVFYSEGDITATPKVTRFDITTSTHGKTDERLDSVIWEIGFTPVGAWTAAVLPILWPYQSPIINSSMLGSVDKNCVIHTTEGRELTFKAAAITSMPGINLSAVKTPMEAVTITAIGANNTAMSDAAKYLVDAAVDFADTSFDPTQIPTVPYSAAWGEDAPWDDIETEEGWNISCDVGFSTKSCDSAGVYDLRLTSVGIMAKCKPIGISEAQTMAALDIQGAGVQRGRSMLANSKSLVITGGAGNPSVTLHNAAPVEAGYTFGAEELRQGELAFVALRSFNEGAAGPLFTVAVG